MILVLLIVFYRHTGVESQLLDDTLKDIENVLDVNKQKELKDLIDRRDIPGVYAFLTTTIREANETKDLFLANMSHEIRTPLNGIVGFTELLKSTEVDSTQKEYIDIIETSSSNLLTIVNDILDLAKIRSNKVELENISFSIIETCESAVEIYAAKAYEKHIKLNLFTDTHLPNSILGDPTKLTQILTNLISNAVKFTKNGGNIDIGIINTFESENTIKIKFLVQDNGIGITKKQKNKIFEAFSQADASTNRKFGGTGLGLSISSKFVEIMGGKLDLKSEENSGTTFFFTIEFEKVKNDSSYFRLPNLEQIRVGYLLSKDEQCTLTNNLEKYISATNASFARYNETQLKNLSNAELPDILFVRHRYYTQDYALDFLKNINISKILITMPNLKNQLPEVESKFEKVIYEPIYLSKTIKALDILGHKITKSKKIINEPKPQVSFNNLKALVVEDNSINQKLIKVVLEGLGIDVTLANNGAEGVKERKTNAYDIIFMDIQMPVLGGIEATKEIINFEKNTNQTHVPIIALTANALKGDKEKYLAHGMDDYSSKPLDLNHIQSSYNSLQPNP